MRAKCDERACEQPDVHKNGCEQGVGKERGSFFKRMGRGSVACPGSTASEEWCQDLAGQLPPMSCSHTKAGHADVCVARVCRQAVSTAVESTAEGMTFSIGI